MRRLFNWRHWVLYSLTIGCIFAILMLCNEAPQTLTKSITNTIMAFALLLGCGYPLCKYTKKWEREGKIKM